VTLGHDNWRLPEGHRGAIICLPNTLRQWEEAYRVAKDAVLFFERAELPRRGEGWLDRDIGPMVSHLEELKIYQRHNFGDASVFNLLHRAERDCRGRWSLWGYSPHLEGLPDRPKREGMVDAFMIRANNSLLVPHREVPIEDLLSFKSREQPRLVALRHRIESVCAVLSKEDVTAYEINAELERFDADLAEANQAIKGQNWRKSLATLEVSVDMGRLLQDVPRAAVASLSGAGFGLTVTQSVLTGLAVASCSLTISRPFVKRNDDWDRLVRNDGAPYPFAYLLALVRDL